MSGLSHSASVAMRIWCFAFIAIELRPIHAEPVTNPGGHSNGKEGEKNPLPQE